MQCDLQAASHSFITLIYSLCLFFLYFLPANLYCYHSLPVQKAGNYRRTVTQYTHTQTHTCKMRDPCWYKKCMSWGHTHCEFFLFLTLRNEKRIAIYLQVPQQVHHFCPQLLQWFPLVHQSHHLEGSRTRTEMYSLQCPDKILLIGKAAEQTTKKKIMYKCHHSNPINTLG